MVLGMIVTAAVGILLLVLGYLLWKKEKMTILHAYHYDKVTQENKKAFCALTGWGLMLLGVGILLTALLLALGGELWSFAPLALAIPTGITLLLAAGNKYNK